MKKKLIILTLLLTLILSACNATTVPLDNIPIDAGRLLQDDNAPDIPIYTQSDSLPIDYTSDLSTAVDFPPPPNRMVQASIVHSTFEETLLLATDVVLAQYVGHRLFGEMRTLIEYEFIVLDRVLGNAADRIFVYAETNVYMSVMGTEISFASDSLSFSAGTDYLLTLFKITQTSANTHEDGFIFLNNLVIDLNNPLNSRMFNEPLANHSTELNFNSRALTSEFIVSYVSERTRNNEPSREPIRSDRLEDIINASANVVVVEVNEPVRLSNEVPPSDWMATDIYHCTVVHTLKGDMEVGDNFTMIFLADTVQTGERHIMAIEQRIGGDNFMFTSRNSLFSIDQLDEIMLILESNH